MIDSKSIEENNIATTQNSYQPPTISYTQYTQPIRQENFQPVTLSNTTEQAQITNPSKKQMYIVKKSLTNLLHHHILVSFYEILFFYL